MKLIISLSLLALSFAAPPQHFIAPVHSPQEGDPSHHASAHSLHTAAQPEDSPVHSTGRSLHGNHPVEHKEEHVPSHSEDDVSHSSQGTGRSLHDDSHTQHGAATHSAPAASHSSHGTGRSLHDDSHTQHGSATHSAPAASQSTHGTGRSLHGNSHTQHGAPTHSAPAASHSSHGTGRSLHGNSHTQHGAAAHFIPSASHSSHGNGRVLLGGPRLENEFIPIMRDERIQEVDGRFNVEFEAANGINFAQAGSPDAANGAVIQAGQYSYIAPDGTEVVMKFVANENGFQPEGNMLPVAPEFPHPIPQFVLDQIAFAEEERARKEREGLSASSSSSHHL